MGEEVCKHCDKKIYYSTGWRSTSRYHPQEIEKAWECSKSPSRHHEPAEQAAGAEVGTPSLHDDAAAIVEKIRSKMRMEGASPTDWVWEALAVLEAERKLTSSVPPAQPEPEHTATDKQIVEWKRQLSFLAGGEHSYANLVQSSLIARIDALKAENEAQRDAANDFRDCALNQRGHLEEGTLNNDQTNAILFAFDDAFTRAALSGTPQSPSYSELMKSHEDLLTACKAQHEAIDRLFAMLIENVPGFYPTKSGQPWAACVQGNEAISTASKLREAE